MILSVRCLFKTEETPVWATNMVGPRRIDETSRLTIVNNLRKSVIQKRILNIKLLDGPLMRECKGEHNANGGRFHHRAKGFIKVKP